PPPTDSRVYPRERGGARSGKPPLRLPPGLSPRTRGSRSCSASASAPSGSIPAHAGEPREGASVTSSGRVYPRARGGALRVLLVDLGREGLSPRTRGSPPWRLSSDSGAGSIPAHAGEPPVSAPR